MGILPAYDWTTMSQELYYTAPSDDIYNDMKDNAIDLWTTYDDKFKYATEKINRIKDLENITDNFMYIYAMFDPINQQKLRVMLQPETIAAIDERLE